MTQDSEDMVPIDLRKYGKNALSFRLWHGMALDAWLRAMRGKWGLVSPSRYPLVVMITICSVGNLFMKWASQIVYGRQLAKVEISPDPIFVIGHWRSGTTWLHRIMMMHPDHAAPDVGACFCPETFLIGRKILTPFLRWAIPDKRPMDNVRLELESAEEDEHGISLSGAVSPYVDSMFPNLHREFPFRPEDMSEKDAAFWRKKWLAFLRRVQFVNPGKRLVLKSPTHTLRTAEILRLFPDARFIHIVRDPYKIFLSSINSRLAMQSVGSLQDHLEPEKSRNARVIRRFVKFHEAYNADKDGIPADQLMTVRYEDLKADPLAAMREIFEKLDLGDFSLIAPEIEKMASAPRPYRNNSYDIDDETIDLIEREFADYFKEYGYKPISRQQASGQ